MPTPGSRITFQSAHMGIGVGSFSGNPRHNRITNDDDGSICHASMHRVKEASQAGNATPNVRLSLSEDSMEYRGLGAGKGYSGVEMGIKFGDG